MQPCGCGRAMRSTCLASKPPIGDRRPTQWQRSQYPQRYHDRIAIVHEGVDTDSRQARRDGAHVAEQRALPFALVTRSSPTAPAISSPIAGSTCSCGRCRKCSAAAEGAGADRRREWRQLRTPAARRCRLPGTAPRRARRDARSAARALSRPPALPAVPDGAADLHRPRLSDVPVRAVLVTARSDVGRLPRRRLPHATGRGSDQRRERTGGWSTSSTRRGLADSIITALTDGADQLRSAARETVIQRYDVRSVCLPAYLDLLKTLLPRGKTL